VSTKDDVLQLATTQTQTQYSSAPDQTIPVSQWPENQNRSTAFQFGYVLGGLIPLVVLVGLILLVVGLVRNRRRAAMAPAMGGAVASGMVQMSNDGHYWWDGQTWRDAAREVPPSAQRSSDGALWWDGQAWRPVAQTDPAPPSGPTPPTST
jgi:hypothetical protein